MHQFPPNQHLLARVKRVCCFFVVACDVLCLVCQRCVCVLYLEEGMSQMANASVQQLARGLVMRPYRKKIPGVRPGLREPECQTDAAALAVYYLRACVCGGGGGGRGLECGEEK